MTSAGSHAGGLRCERARVPLLDSAPGAQARSAGTDARPAQGNQTVRAEFELLGRTPPVEPRVSGGTIVRRGHPCTGTVEGAEEADRQRWALDIELGPGDTAAELEIDWVTPPEGVRFTGATGEPAGSGRIITPVTLYRSMVGKAQSDAHKMWLAIDFVSTLTDHEDDEEIARVDLPFLEAADLARIDIAEREHLRELLVQRAVFRARAHAAGVDPRHFQPDLCGLDQVNDQIASLFHKIVMAFTDGDHERMVSWTANFANGCMGSGEPTFNTEPDSFAIVCFAELMDQASGERSYLDNYRELKPLRNAFALMLYPFGSAYLARDTERRRDNYDFNSYRPCHGSTGLGEQELQTWIDEAARRLAEDDWVESRWGSFLYGLLCDEPMVAAARARRERA